MSLPFHLKSKNSRLDWDSVLTQKDRTFHEKQECLRLELHPVHFAPVNTVLTESLLLVQENLNKEDTEMRMNSCHIFSGLELLTLQNNSENVVWQNEPRKPRQVTMVS